VVRVFSLTTEQEQRESVEGFVQQLRNTGRSVEFIPERQDYPTTPSEIIETMAIFLGSSIGSAIISATVNDIYNTARQWIRERRKKRETKQTSGIIPFQRIIIYGPDRDEIASWSTWELDDTQP
jgi:hypothetical protein